MGVLVWVECVVTEPSYFKLCTEHCPVHLALLDEVASCHQLLHHRLLRLLVQLFESPQDELEILVQVSKKQMSTPIARISKCGSNLRDLFCFNLKEYKALTKAPGARC